MQHESGADVFSEDSIMAQRDRESSIKIAIVGSGPAGFYSAEALILECAGCEVDIFERLPTPYGLIRSGVAPDHQATKAIQSTFEKTAQLSNCRFIGNVQIGRDVSLEKLREVYDAVILASGTPLDAPLDIPGAALSGVYGATQFVGWYNGHPDHAALDPNFDSNGAVVIGNGNVAIDVARILSKSAAELSTSDIAVHAMRRITASPVSNVHIVGRRGPVEAKFTNVELRELGELEQAVAIADPSQIPDDVDATFSARDRRMKIKNLECFKEFSKADPSSAQRSIRFHFNAKPVEVIGQDRVEAVRFEQTRVESNRVVGTGKFFDIPCSLVIYAIGYRPSSALGLTVGATGTCFENVDGKIDQGLYVVGWLKRGPSGKIGTNRVDGEDIARKICAEVRAGGKPGFAALRADLMANGVRLMNFVDWKAVDAAEIAKAAVGAPRQKFVFVEEMLTYRAEARAIVS
jgi:NADPH-dependent glutamate synthase beta subunit-like oxidoreductase